MNTLSLFSASGRRLLCSFIILLLCCAAFAQPRTVSRSRGYITPGGYLDTVIDRFGNRYSLDDIRIRDNSVKAGKPGRAKTTTVATCSSGYFQLYLENGCGLEGTDAASMARLSVVCQVLNDLSQFIISPLSSGAGGQKINIWVRDISSFGASGAGLAGLATAFHNQPRDLSGALSGISDNTIWITATSGVDAYKNVVNPVSIPGGYVNTTTYYHGIVAFQHNGSVNWHTDLATYPAAGETDMYTVALHEITHALGFASLIGYNGASVFGAGYNYYSRYDQHLATQSGAHLVTTTSAATCGMYGWSFNSSLTPFTVLSPGGTSSSCASGYLPAATPVADHTTCTNAIKYIGGTTQTVYSPSCYEKGSSLSHFEDECFVPSGFPLSMGSASNNQYFVMANAIVPGPYSATTNPGACKRSLTPEERQVLCDIGYSVGTTFGTAANHNNVTYTGAACPGLQVAGICDGISPTGAYTYFTTPGNPVQINGGAAGSLTGNDYNAASFKCLEVAIGSGTLSAATGTAATTVTYTPSATSYGVQLLRYIPVSASGAEGNITYVYVYVGDPACIPTACNLVSNGDIENSMDSCGDIQAMLGIVHCWTSFYGSPDLYSRDCSDGSSEIPYIYTTPPTNTFDYPATGNNHFIGFYGEFYPPNNCIGEGMQNPLTSGLIPGNEYYVSFWAKNALVGTIMANLDHYIQFVASPITTPVAPLGYTITGIPAGWTPLDAFLIPGDGHWYFFKKKIRYTGTEVANMLGIYDGTFLDPLTTPAYDTAHYTYTFFDNISIEPVSGVSTFNIPPTICLYDTIIDLTSTVSVPGGTFTWDSLSAGTPVQTHSSMFNAMTAYAASQAMNDSGLVTISYTYTNALGCTQTVYAQTRVILSTYTPITGSLIVNAGGSTTLSNATGGGSWYSDDTTIATVNASTGVVTGVSYGSVNIYYHLPSGCIVSALMLVGTTGVPAVQATGKAISIYPNPGDGTFRITGPVAFNSNTVVVTNMMGITIYSAGVTAANGAIDATIRLPADLPAGNYIIKVAGENNIITLLR